MAGFCDSADGLQTPNLATSREKSPIVSGEYLKYSRFWETAAGDRVRSALRGRPGSDFIVLGYELGNPPTLRNRSSNGGGSFESKSSEIAKSYCSERTVI